MKYFKCGKCSAPYKIDETKVSSTQVVLTCPGCGAKNVLNFGIVLIAQSKERVSEFKLKMGNNFIGRGTDVEIKIDDNFISRKHANVRLEQHENKLVLSVEDCGSLNGVYDRNKKRLKADLKHNMNISDFFIVGLTKIAFKIN